MLLSIRDYAEKCGVSVQQIAYRLKTPKLEIDEVESDRCGGKVIDINIYPPIAKQKAGRPRLSNKIL